MLEKQFEYITQLIESARYRAYQSVNQELIQLYWEVGAYLSKKVKEDSWGQSTVQELADYIQLKHPDLKGFSRMSQIRINHASINST